MISPSAENVGISPTNLPVCDVPAPDHCPPPPACQVVAVDKLPGAAAANAARRTQRAIFMQCSFSMCVMCVYSAEPFGGCVRSFILFSVVRNSVCFSHGSSCSRRDALLMYTVVLPVEGTASVVASKSRPFLQVINRQGSLELPPIYIETREGKKSLGFSTFFTERNQSGGVRKEQFQTER